MSFSVKDASGTPRPVMSALVGSDHAQQIGWAMQSQSDTFTATGNGAAIDVSALGMSTFGLQVKQTGTVTAWTVVLEGSLDGTNYQAVLQHTKSGEGDGAIVWTGASRFPALYFRSHCTVLTLGGGTNVEVTIVGMP